MPPPPGPADIEEVTPPEAPTDEGTPKPTATGPRARKDAAPKRGPGRPPKPDLGKKVAELVESIGTALTGAAMISGSKQTAYDAAVLLERADDVGEMMGQLAKENPAIARSLERLFTVSGWGKVSMTLAAVVLPIAANHGMMPPILAAPFFPSVGAPPERPQRARPVSTPNSQPATNGTAPAAPIPEQERIPGWPDDLPLPN